MPLYWIWFAMLPGLTGWQKCSLLEHFPNPEDIYHGEAQAFSELPWVTGEVLEALRSRELAEPARVLRECTDKNIRLVTYGDPDYPQRLRCIPQPPVLLYCQGNLPDFDGVPSVAVVGTRKASPYGLQSARDLSSEIAACGGIVVTGGAAGIDTMAAMGALDGAGTVVLVLGCGVDLVYPRQNRLLFSRVLQTGCLLSEYPPGTPAYRWNFPQRNRILSGLTNGTLVVEAPERSGALITARDALEQGRDVFVVPGNIRVDSCAGSNQLLREGAAAVFTGGDILREYQALYPGKIHIRDIPVRPPASQAVAQKPVLPEKILPKQKTDEKKAIDNGDKSHYSVLNGQHPELTEQEQAIAALVRAQPINVDDVIDASGLPPGKVLSVLTMLKLKGVVQDHPGRRISLKNH